MQICPNRDQAPSRVLGLAARLLTIIGGVGLIFETTPGRAASIEGFIDALSASGATGWACIRGTGQTVSIGVYTGAALVGIFPTTVVRSDVYSTCGGMATYGFNIDFLPNIAQQLYGRTDITVTGMATGYATYTLPPSSGSAANPFQIPTGSVSTASTSGTIRGSVTTATGTSTVPQVNVFSIAPYGSAGTTNLGAATTALSGPGTYAFSLTSSTIGTELGGAPTGYALPIYAYASDTSGAYVPLTSPIALNSGSAIQESLDNEVAQSGSESGITNTIFTTWLPSNSTFYGLTGSVSLSGNVSGFNEALVVYGYTTGNEAACAAENDTSPSPLPTIYRIGAAILKNNGPSAQKVPIDFALPYGMPLSGSGGTCLITLISAGYAYLSPDVSAYTDTTSNLTASFLPNVTGAPTAFPAGVGNEFRFPSGATSSEYTIVALRVRNTTALDAIAGSASAAGVVGAPSGSIWLPNPTGNWTATTSFYYYPASACAGIVSFASSNAYYDIGISSTPMSYTVPSSATLLASMPLSGLASSSVQQSIFQAFASASTIGSSSVTLSTNDCLVTLHNVSTPSGTLTGNLDFENQSTAYFHLSP